MLKHFGEEESSYGKKSKEYVDRVKKIMEDYPSFNKELARMEKVAEEYLSGKHPRGPR